MFFIFLCIYVGCKELYSLSCLFIGSESSCAKFVLCRVRGLSFILESLIEGVIIFQRERRAYCF